MARAELLPTTEDVCDKLRHSNALIRNASKGNGIIAIVKLLAIRDHSNQEANMNAHSITRLFAVLAALGATIAAAPLYADCWSTGNMVTCCNSEGFCCTTVWDGDRLIDSWCDVKAT